MKTLIFDDCLSGHHPEYLNHLWIAASGCQTREYVFAVPEEGWAEVMHLRDWPDVSNISVRLLTKQEICSAQRGNQISECWRKSKLVKKIAQETGATEIFMITLAGVIPFLPMMLPEGVSVSGIIYKIFLRTQQGPAKALADKLRYRILAKSGRVNRVFILNDQTSANILNKKYSSTRFERLSDPVPNINLGKLRSIRAELSIESDKKVFLHFGSMDGRKGTLIILDAIRLLSADELTDKVFVFAGKVNPSIRESFYDKLAQAREHGAHIIVNDEFCDYDFLNNLSFSSDCLLIPYSETAQSSGVLGYAAVLGRPVIGPASGLIGELIKKYGLGMAVTDLTAATLADAIRELKLAESNGAEYIRVNSLDEFKASIIGDNSNI